MSRTIRHKRPKMRLGALSKRQYADGRVRDGTPTHVSGGCQHHGVCPYCRGNRTFSSRRREPVEDVETNTESAIEHTRELDDLKLAYTKMVMRGWRDGGGAWLLVLLSRIRDDWPTIYARALEEL